MKKTLCMLLALLMTASMFVGCGDGGASANATFNQEIADKLGDTGGLKLPLTDKAAAIEWSVTTAHEDFGSSWFATRIREATGVDVQFRVVPSASAKDKMSVWIASRDLPDIIGQGVDLTVGHDLAAQGGIAAVEDYLDVLPNFKATFVDNKDNNWVFNSYAAPHDGKLYGFYGWDYNRDVNHGMLYRKDIFDKHSIPMWNSPDTFYSAMKKLKELYPASTPFTSKNQDGLFQKLSNSWGIMAFKPYYDEVNDVWKYTDTDATYKDMLDYLKKLYDEKLLDPEFLTLTQAAWTSKMTQADKAFATFDWIGRLDMFKQQATAVPDYDLRYANPIGPNQSVAQADQLCWARYVANTDNAELAFKLLDFTLSPAGKELVTLGIKGETYEIGEDGMAKYLEYSYEDAENTPDMSKLLDKYGMFTEGVYLSFDRRSVYFNFTEKEKEAQVYGAPGAKIDPLDPKLVFTAEEQEKINDIQAKLDTAGREFASKYILSAETGDSAWNAWVEKAKGLGADEMIKIYNDAQKRLNAN